MLDALGILIIGTFVWFFTLMERNNYHKAFQDTTAQNRIAIQDKVSNGSRRLYWPMVTDICPSVRPIVPLLWLFQHHRFARSRRQHLFVTAGCSISQLYLRDPYHGFRRCHFERYLHVSAKSYFHLVNVGMLICYMQNRLWFHGNRPCVAASIALRYQEG